MPQDNAELLRDAIARNCGVVVSFPSAGMLRHHKSRFVAEDPAGFWIESVAAETPLIDELINTAAPAGLSFKTAMTKLVFTAPILRRQENFQVNGETAIAALLVRQPAELKSIQRRSNYRVSVTDDSGLAVRVWRIAERTYINDRPQAAQEVVAKLIDLSTGGIGVSFSSKTDDPPRVSNEDRLRIALTLGEGLQLVVEGRMRYPVNPPKDRKVIRAGIQFKSLEADLQGRQKLATLTRIIGEMQRAEARRYRMGVA